MYCYKSTGTQISGDVISSGTNTIVLDASASGANDAYNGWILTITAGSGAGQTRVITNFEDTGNIATVNEDWDVGQEPQGPTDSEYTLNESQFIVDEVNGAQNMVIPLSTTVPASSKVPVGSLRFNTTGNELEVGQNDNTWKSVVGSVGVGALTGYITGCIVTYVSSTQITVSSGVVHVSGTMYTPATTASFTPSKSAGINYVYFDKTNEGVGVNAYYASATDIPTYSPTHAGWYHPTNTDDRMIGIFYSHNDTNTILEFITTRNGSDLIITWGRKLDSSVTGTMNTYNTPYDGTSGLSWASYIKTPRTMTKLFGNFILRTNTTTNANVYWADNNTFDIFFGSVSWGLNNLPANTELRRPTQLATNFHRDTDTRSTAFYTIAYTTNIYTGCYVSGVEITR